MGKMQNKYFTLLIPSHLTSHQEMSSQAKSSQKGESLFFRQENTTLDHDNDYLLRRKLMPNG